MADNNEEEFDTTFYIPQNFAETGKIINGMFETRNVIEAVLILGILGYVEFNFIHIKLLAKAVIMLITILPAVIITLTGIDGYSLSDYLMNIFSYLSNKRKLHFRRVGYVYAETSNQKQKKAPSKKDNSGKQEKDNNKNDNDNDNE